MRRRFGSSVSFSPSRIAKEFFLVVSFSFAAFHLSEEAVALVLQCCLGGLAADFRVFKFSNKRFRFSVASNKVGHFVYSLRDRVWPDFTCHFHLFRGDPKVFPSDNIDKAAAVWFEDFFARQKVSRRSLAVHTNLDFLKPKEVTTVHDRKKGICGEEHHVDFLRFGSFPPASLGAKLDPQ